LGSICTASLVYAAKPAGRGTKAAACWNQKFGTVKTDAPVLDGTGPILGHFLPSSSDFFFYQQFDSEFGVADECASPRIVESPADAGQINL